MTHTREIRADEWKAYFDSFSKKFLFDSIPESAEIEVISPSLGVQEEAHQGRLLGLTYDDKDQTLEVSLDKLNHRIRKPQRIWTEEEDNGFLRSVEVECPNEQKEILQFRQVGLQKRVMAP